MSPTPIALSGPLGCGRRMLARRLHFESALQAAPLKRVQATLADLDRALAPGAPACGLIVERALEIDLAQQARIAQLIEERAECAARLFLLLDRPLSVAAEQGALAPELAWHFSRVELKLAPLCQRRLEIAPLAQLFAAHFAAQENVRTPELDDGAQGFLWRQPWNGNVRELAQWMYRLVLCSPGALIDASVLDNLGMRFGQTTLQRIPSRHPDRELLCAALQSTANRKGTWNKTRAALYLGWDTDTLQSRINEAGLGHATASSPAADPAARVDASDAISN
jgi:DNA-binding NtrC family response regulator